MSKNKVKKHGAGFLFKSDNEILLLLRSDKSKNSNKWGLPGGNLEPNESELKAAVRETTEEIGGCPPNFHVLGKIDILRGKNQQKLYHVYLAEISKNDKERFEPHLNGEHSDFKWFDINEAMTMNNLHSIPEKLFKDYKAELDNILINKTTNNFALAD